MRRIALLILILTASLSQAQNSPTCEKTLTFAQGQQVILQQLTVQIGRMAPGEKQNAAYIHIRNIGNLVATLVGNVCEETDENKANIYAQAFGKQTVREYALLHVK